MIPGLNDMGALAVEPVTASYDIEGKKITFETGMLAQLIDGSIVMKDEDGNFLLTTAGVNKNPNINASYFPLSVDFQERYYSTGKIGGGRFMKREGRPSVDAILASRVIDRPIRPMFPKGVVNEVQIIPTLMSASGKSDVSFYGVTGASLALMLGGVTEFEGPVSAAKIALVDGKFIFDPSFEQLEESKLEMLVAGTEDMVTMVEFKGNEASDEEVMDAFTYAGSIVKKFCEAQLDFLKKYTAKYAITEVILTKGKDYSELSEKVFSLLSANLIQEFYGLGKVDFYNKLHEVEEMVKEKLEYTEDTEEITAGAIADAVYSYVKKNMRKNILETGVRLDNRKPTDVRPVTSHVSFLPRTHGSALFRRGITSSLSIVTLGGPSDGELVDGIFKEHTRRYMHHYNFPPYSVGEVRMMRGVGRREIGHGNLGEKALVPVLPKEEDFPYTIRVVSEITTCNGSSSMAAVCGSSMALMDAGVPIKAPVSGVAMGMIYDEETGKYEILSDIQAQEDFLGDLDFKVAGTKEGITALQMDTKISGLSLEVVKKVLTQSYEARMTIMDSMTHELKASREELSPYAPSLISFMIPVDKIREVIGKGGETIQKIQRENDVEIGIEDNGSLVITAPDGPTGSKVEKIIKDLIKDLEVGDFYTGRVAKILPGVGAIVDLGSGKSGMIHISKLADKRVENVEDIVKEKDTVEVKVLTVDKEKGRVGLQRIEK